MESHRALTNHSLGGQSWQESGSEPKAARQTSAAVPVMEIVTPSVTARNSASNAIIILEIPDLSDHLRQIRAGIGQVQVEIRVFPVD